MTLRRTIAKHRFLVWLVFVCTVSLLVLLPLFGQRSSRRSARMYRLYAEGLLVRTNYQAEKSGPYNVEIWDLLVGPGKSTESVALPGAAVFEVRSGSAVITLDNEPRPVRVGATLSIDQDQQFRIDNSEKEESFMVRAVIVSSNP